MPQRPALTPVLRKFKNALAEQKHLYACGGRIPIAPPPAGDGVSQRPASASAPPPAKQSEPVTIRWDTGTLDRDNQVQSRRVTLPATQQCDRDALNTLIQGCKPATFGLGSQDVLDETYRKALKMDTSAFCTTFDPYSLGIINTVTQMLLPSFRDAETYRAVDARLYKLNIYSGPSGMFKAHVDTPRSPTQFGSLVVCLPVEHQGGQLKVRHKGEETVFDWSACAGNGETPHIEWAAFYSDCEHEVMEVSSGHRLTLTYNLLAVHGAGRLTGSSSVLDPTRLPLHHAIERLIADDPLSGKGGTLGFWCSHAYAYNDAREAPLPATLKGVDAALWESFRALGITVKIRPIIQVEDEVRKLIAEANGGGSDSDSDNSRYMPSKWVIGKDFGVERNRGYQIEDGEQYEKLFKRWGSFSGPIYWLTEPQHKELQLIYTAYGNEGCADTLYSHCAMLVTLPKNTSKTAAKSSKAKKSKK